MNLYEHLEIVERASGLSKAHILKSTWWDLRFVAAKLDDDALVSLRVVQHFIGEQADAKAHQVAA